MVTGSTFSADLSDAEWLAALRQLGDQRGSFADLGDKHCAVFVEHSDRVLFVAFETVFGIRSGSDSGTPIAFDVCERRGWSHLTILSKGQTWFRDESVFGFFDRLVDQGFFDRFDRVLFYGAGMCGYAAGAFSVCAPGAVALLIAPQATLERNVAAWDDRFPSTRRLNFGGRFADAAYLAGAAETALVIYDPEEIEDAMHASLFRTDNVIHHRYRRGAAGAIESDLRTLSLVSKLADLAVSGDLNSSSAAAIMRARKRHVPYLRALLARVVAEERPQLTLWLCRAVLEHQPLPRFRHHLERAEIQLGLRTTLSDERQSAKRDDV